jgi:serine/threonine-protein phosphatase Stp1
MGSQATRRGEGVTAASTLVVLVAREQRYTCLWAGDSRAYLLRGNSLTQITHDHSLVQSLVDAGAITAEEALSHPRGYIITRAVGAEAEDANFALDEVSGPLAAGDRLLLCSDGLNKALHDPELAALLATAAPAEALLAAALAQQATDNVTAVAVEVVA